MMAVHFIQAQQQQATDYVILTDSKSIIEKLKSLNAGDAIPPLLIDLISAIVGLLSGGINVELSWVASHVGIAGNEQIDRLVGLTTMNGVINDDTTTPYSDMNTLFKHRTSQLWKEHYEHATAVVGKWSKEIFMEPPQKPWFNNVSFSPREITTITRLLICHGFTPYFRLLMGKINEIDAICPSCEPLQRYLDVYHILQDCRDSMPTLRRVIEPFENVKEFLRANLNHPENLKKIQEALSDLDITI